MGIHPKIGITGLPRSGKSAVLAKVLEMLEDERRREINARGGDGANTDIIGGMRNAGPLDSCAGHGRLCPI